MSVFIIFLLSHLATDFVLQSDGLVARKRSPETARRGLIEHGLIHLVVATGLFGLTGRLDLAGLGLVVLVSLLHGLIDRLKLSLSRRMGQTSLGLFAADQLVHIGLIAGLSFYFYPGGLTALRLSERILGALVGLLFSLPAGGIIIGLILDKLRYREMAPSQPQPAIGRYIGYLERSLIIYFILAGSLSGLGLLATFKTLARFRQLEDQAFAEYYILGTLLSLLFGISGGYMIRFFLG